MSKNVEITMLDESSLNTIRSIVAEEIRRYAEEQAIAKAARPKARAELSAEEAAQYMTVDEVAAVTGYGVPSLRSMASKKFAPAGFPILPVKVGLRSLYVRADVLASAKAQQFAEQADGFIATPKQMPPTQTIDVTPEPAGALGATIQNAIAAAKKPATKKAPATKQAAPVAAKKTPAAKKAPVAAKKTPAAKKATTTRRKTA
ncbi:hypothetical protein BG58_33005 [Caballeronia jiangsuensis]|nr:hypothetical protein BG58_33005 [Caballeronia jiangsuensis]